MLGCFDSPPQWAAVETMDRFNVEIVGQQGGLSLSDLGQLRVRCTVDGIDAYRKRVPDQQQFHPNR